MSPRIYLSYGAALLLFIYSGCKESSTESSKEAATISGRVVDYDQGVGIVGAEITDEGSSSASARSDASGNFTISFGVISSTYNTSLRISHSGYTDETRAVSVKPGENQGLSSHILLQATGSGVIVTDPDVYNAAKIEYISTVPANGGINVSGVGGVENAVLTYEVQDKLGDAVTKTPRYGATYSIAFYPNSSVGGGTWPTVIPASDSTDANGRLKVSVASGTQAGVVEVLVRVNVVRTSAPDTIIESSPVKVTVYGGFPDQDHFSLMPSRFVFPNMEALNTIKFTVAIGDTFSNPVRPGTAVYFHSQAGIMTTGNTSNSDGFATADLFTVSPAPNQLPYYDPNIIDYVNGGTVGRIGYEWVVAQTEGRNGTWIKDSVFVVWNQAPIIITGLPASLTMTHQSTSSVVSITVTDVNNNPLCDGAKISASFTYPDGIDGIKFKAAGNVPTTIPAAGYARFHGDGITDFSFVVTDASIVDLTGFMVTLDISVQVPGLLIDPVNISLPIFLN